MEILKPGKLPEDGSAEPLCRHCGCEFRVRQGEGAYHSDQRDGDFISFTCPTCRKSVTVSVSLFK